MCSKSPNSLETIQDSSAISEKAVNIKFSYDQNHYFYSSSISSDKTIQLKIAANQLQQS
jgi:hypothetical protein